METFGTVLAGLVDRLTAANIFCGHGYESIHDEAVALMLGAAGLPPEQSRELLAAPFPANAMERLALMVQER